MNRDYLVLNDIHIADEARRPSSRKPGYTEQILDKIRFAGQYAFDRNLPIIQLDDVFNLKNSGKNSHKLIQQTHEALNWENPVLLLMGNHDAVSLDRTEGTAWGSLVRMRNMYTLAGLEPDLGVVGIPYNVALEDARDWEAYVRSWLDFLSEGEADTICIHAPFFPPGQEPGVFFSIPTDKYAKLVREYGIVRTFAGHIHDYHGVYEVEGHTFINQGALSRNSIHESNLLRTPKITHFQGGNIITVEVPHKEPEEVFAVTEAIAAARNKASAQAFADAFSQTQFSVLTIEQLRDTLAKDVSDPEVRQIILDSLE